MVRAGYWQQVTPDDPAIDSQFSASGNWAEWNAPASRGRTAQVLRQAPNSHYGTNRLP